MSKNDDINLKVLKVKKSKKSFLSLIATAIGLGAKEAKAYIAPPPPPMILGPILVPAPIAPPPTPIVAPPTGPLQPAIT